ncbi:hypothetical protein PFISCL1PPCAC_2108 [Pristionchus fissidentatus]|uniref:Uncharacterized protein n=1 Tax=Pristionchus fissidentatus TaxID=1538716 RepID=A0AAV5UUM1_9BILA|nr:hypothetical protein PFISCL1PPCAC_2108 [Pristionchus fissidentatus]
MLLLLFSSILLSASSQMIAQCPCSIVEPCYTNGADYITQCADRCQNHFTSLGLSYPTARQCILNQLPAMTDTVECARQNFGEVCAARPGPLVPKRYGETMQLAAFRELNEMIFRSGLAGEMGVLSKVTKKALGCVTKCMKQRGCAGSKTCGLALPSDNQVVKTFKSCAQARGLLTTQTVKLLLFCSLFVSVSSQLIPQCTCNEVGPCYENIADILTQCADRCQNHFTSIGVSYPVARQCILDKLPGFSSTLDCAKSNFGQVCAAQPGPTVPKRYAETLQLAAFRELSGMLNQSGLSGTGAALTKVARKAVGCIAKCVRTRGCSGTKSCGLALPSDTQIVQTFKSCATSTGLLTTPALQSMCGCLVSAGLPQLADACPSLRVN